jgi:hypothetical protein
LGAESGAGIHSSDSTLHRKNRGLTIFVTIFHFVRISNSFCMLPPFAWNSMPCICFLFFDITFGKLLAYSHGLGCNSSMPPGPAEGGFPENGKKGRAVA